MKYVQYCTNCFTVRLLDADDSRRGEIECSCCGAWTRQIEVSDETTTWDVARAMCLGITSAIDKYIIRGELPPVGMFTTNDGEPITSTQGSMPYTGSLGNIPSNIPNGSPHPAALPRCGNHKPL